MDQQTPFESFRSDATDAALVALTVLLAALPTGPVAVALLFGHLSHWGLVGRPRAALAPVYLCLGFAVQAFRSDGLLEWAPVPLAAARAGLALAAALALAFDRLLCPLRGRVPAPTGAHDAALLVVTSKTDFQLRLYYPTPRRSAEERAREARRERSKPPAGVPYFLQGRAEVAAGMAAALDLPSSLLVSWLGETRPWALQGSHSTPCVSASQAGEGALRVLVLSHSLTSTPDLYGGLIGELVSHGFIVAAIEHGDGSAAYTLSDDRTTIPFKPLTAAERRDPRKEYKLRRSQMRTRVDEMRACADVLQEIATRPYDPSAADADAQNEGESEDMLFARLMLCGRIAPVQAGVPRSLLTCIGHSLGGATCIAALEEDRRFGAAVLFDPWLFPLSATTLSRGLAHAPILTLIGETWRESPSFMAGARILWDEKFRRTFRREARGGDAEGDVDGLDVSMSNGVAPDGSVDPKFFVRSGAVNPGSAVALVSGLRHYSFTDGPVLAETALRLAGKIGSRPGADVHRVVAALTRGFLKKLRVSAVAKVPANAVAQDLGVTEAEAASFDVMGSMALSGGAVRAARNAGAVHSPC